MACWLRRLRRYPRRYDSCCIQHRFVLEVRLRRSLADRRLLKKEEKKEDWRNNMRKFLFVALIAIIGFMPLTASAEAQRAQESNKGDYYPFILGVGAIGGVALFNLITGGWAAIPFATSSIEVAGLWEGQQAINRVIAVSSAVAGLWAANWAYYNYSPGR